MDVPYNQKRGIPSDAPFLVLRFDFFLSVLRERVEDHFPLEVEFHRQLHRSSVCLEELARLTERRVRCGLIAERESVRLWIGDVVN